MENKLRITESKWVSPLTLNEWMREVKFGSRYDDVENKGFNDYIAYMKRIHQEKLINNQKEKK